MTTHTQPFVHLHLHSDYSLLDGACRIDKALHIAREMGMPAMALTDHGNMFGAVEFYNTARKIGIKPIIGSELYISPGSCRVKEKLGGDLPDYNHLVLLARNQAGYRNLVYLSSYGYLEGFYYKPRIDKEVLRQHSTGLIGLSACLGGEVPWYIRRGDLPGARKAIREYQEIFGAENFYLELQSNGISEQYTVNDALIALSKETGAPLVATNDCHYLKREDFDAHDTLICLQTGKRKDEPERFRMETNEFYIKSPQEMFEQFAHVEEALKNTVEIAQRCNVEILEDKDSFPLFDVPDSYTPQPDGSDPLMAYLRDISYAGTRTRYPEITEEIQARLDYELGVIAEMGYPGYFLIVWDLIKKAREMGIPVGPGRGSAAGSLVAYALRITQLDPLRYNLLFERFLNPERISMPDIDIDFCYNRRKEVIDYVVQKYGRMMVTQIITFGTMAARGVIRDVGRVLDAPLSDVDKIAKLVPEGPGVKLASALEIPDFKHLVDSNPKLRQVVETALRLEGLRRHCSTHAAGVVIASREVTDFVPLYKGSKGEITTQYDMGSLEYTGMLKMDFLGLRTLTVIYDTVDTINLLNKSDMDIDTIPIDDKKTFELISEGLTCGIFQLESSGMREMLRKLRPTRFEEIIAAVALYRPGPLESGMVQTYIDRKNGIEFEYPHSLLEPVLEETFGVILYQEQVMKIANVLSGFSLGEADILRKAMGKKKIDLMEKMRDKFVADGHRINNIPEKTLNYIYELIIKFAGYGFNKSHSAAYALIAYQTAYLKAHHPTAFMAALLSSEIGDQKKITKYIAESKALGIEVLPPDINESARHFAVTGPQTIRFGLAAIQNVGDMAIESIMRSRTDDGQYTSLFDFCQRVNLSKVNKRVIESLAKSGAMASLGVFRSQLLAAIDGALADAAAAWKDRQSGQTSLFDHLEESSAAEVRPSYPDLPELPKAELLSLEKELLGFWITGHPLAKDSAELAVYTSSLIGDLGDLSDGSTVTIGGIVTQLTKKISQKGNPYINAIMEDETGPARILLLGRNYDNYQEKFADERVLLVEAQLKKDEDSGDITLMTKSVYTLEEARADLSGSVHISLLSLQCDDHTLNQLHDLILRHHGPCRLYLHLKSEHAHNHTDIVEAGARFAVAPSDDFMAGVGRLIGDGHCQLSSHR